MTSDASLHYTNFEMRQNNMTFSKTLMTKSSHQKTLPTGEIDANC